MKNFAKNNLILKSALALALATPLLASAESDITIGTGNAVARLDCRIIIPQVLYFAVGTGNGLDALTLTLRRVARRFANDHGPAKGMGGACKA